MDRRQGPPQLRAKPRSQVWPWIIVTLICMLGFVLVFRALLARTEWSAGSTEVPNGPADEIGHFAAAEAAAISGDEAALRQHSEAMREGLLRDMKMPDPNRQIDPESARAAVRSLPGVRSSAWADRENLIVMVGSEVYRNNAMIDAICRQLDPLGDTLAVVVHLQNIEAGNDDELRAISRNCQLEPGDRAFLQSRRTLNAVPESVRQQHKAFDRQVKQGGTAKEDKAAIDALMKNTPEM